MSDHEQAPLQFDSSSVTPAPESGTIERSESDRTSRQGGRDVLIDNKPVAGPKHDWPELAQAVLDRDQARAIELAAVIPNGVKGLPEEWRAEYYKAHPARQAKPEKPYVEPGWGGYGLEVDRHPGQEQ